MVLPASLFGNTLAALARTALYVSATGSQRRQCEAVDVSSAHR